MSMFTNAAQKIKGMGQDSWSFIKSAPGSVANGTANAYSRNKLANKASFGTGARLLQGAMQDGMKGLRGAWDASSRKGQSAFMGSMAGMVGGAGMGYAASPDGWGGAGAAGGAAAGLFGGARAGNFASAFARNHSFVSKTRSGLAGPQPSMMNRASHGFSSATSSTANFFKNGADSAGKAWGSFKNGYNESKASRGA